MDIIGVEQVDAQHALARADVRNLGAGGRRGERSGKRPDRGKGASPESMQHAADLSMSNNGSSVDEIRSHSSVEGGANPPRRRAPAWLLVLAVVGCGKVEENPFGPGGPPDDPDPTAPEPLVFEGDRVVWASAVRGLARVEIGLPDDRATVFAWAAEGTAPDTTGVLPLLAWPLGTRDSLDLVLRVEDEDGVEHRVTALRAAVQGWSPPATPSFLRATMIDVGWGDAHLLETPSGRRVLIDTGSGDNQGSLRALLEDRLTWLGPEGNHIDDLVITHLHADHYTGLTQTVMAPCGNPDYQVGSVYFSTPYITTKAGTYGWLRSCATSGGAEVAEPETGDLLDFGPELDVLVLNAGNPFAPSSDDGTNENNSSFVFRVSYGDVDLIYTGDAETPLIDTVRGRFAGALDALVLKVGHHGSNDATERTWASSVSARVALVPIDAAQVEYALPHDGVIDILHGAGSTVFRSDSIVPGAAYWRDVTGHVEVITDGSALTVRTVPTGR